MWPQLAAACFFGALAGLAMGYGGRLAGLWSVRAELLALSRRVEAQELLPTAKRLSEVGEAVAAVRQCEEELAKFDTRLNSLTGKLNQGEKPRRIQAEDLEFICAAVISKLQRRASNLPPGKPSATGAE